MREMRREIGSRHREAPLWTELRARYSGMVLYFTPTGFSIVSVSLPTSMKQPFTFSPFIWLNLFTLYTSPKLHVHHFKQLQQESPTVSSRESNAAQRLCVLIHLFYPLSTTSVLISLRGGLWSFSDLSI